MKNKENSMGMCSKKHALRAMCFIVAGLAANAGVAMANDLACDAEVIGALPYVPSAADAVNATDDIDTGCNTTSATATRKGVWYRYNATSNTGILVADTSSNDTAMAVFVGPDCNNLTEIHCNDDADGIGFPVTAGQSYWILVGLWGTTANPTVPYALTFTELAAPANDSACTAQAIVSGASSVVDARTAGGDAPAASCTTTANSRFGTRHSVWYRIDPTATGGALNVNETNSNSTVVMQLFSGSTCNDLSIVTCSAAQNTNFTLAANTTYWLSIGLDSFDDMATATGQYTAAFTFFPPATNDDCANAVELNVAGGSTGVAAMGATADPDVTCNSSSASGATAGVWYHINTGLDSGVLSITETSAVDVVIVIYEGQCGALNQLVCSDPEANISTPLNPNTDYYVLIANYYAAQPTAPYAFTYTTGIQTGACCVGANCQILSSGNCTTQGGTYSGDNTLCGAGNPNASDSTASPIPDGTDLGTIPGLLTKTLDVTGSDIISNIEVVTNMTHSWCGDLRLTLTSPNNTSLILVERPNTTTCPAPFTATADTSNYGGIYRFSDAGSQTLRAAALAVGDVLVPPGTYQASNCLGTVLSLNTAFAGQAMAGTWTLTVEDLDQVDTGTLNGWGLVINGGVTITCDSAPTPCEIADFNDSGSVTADDIFAFLDAWFAQNGQTGANLSADVNDSDSVTADDIFAYLDLWFAQNGQSCN